MLKTSNLFLSFIVSSNRNRSALVRELLCNNSLFVGQLYEDKSLALRARDLIFFTSDLHRANVKKSCYMKQQSHSSESARCFDVICH